MERRNFLKTALLGTVAGAVGIKTNGLIAKDNSDSSAQGKNDLVAVMGGEPVEMYKRAIAAMGGIKQYVKPGQKIVVKPNIGWDKTPEFGANTNPDLVAAIVKDCLDAGAKQVVVFDNTCDEQEACYKNSGVIDAARKAGATIAFANDEKYFTEVSLPKGKKLKSAKIHKDIVDCDAWINVPVLKTHGGARLTISMKNLMGIVWDRQFWHRNNLQQCIADCSTYEKMPVLNIVDAYRIMTQNGPKGKSLEDVQLAKAIFMSTDIVAVDTAATRFFNQFKQIPLSEVEHIALAEEHKIGTTDLDKLQIERIRI